MKSITCKDAVHFVLKNEEGKLTLHERLSLWRHLAICHLCRIFSRQNRLINRVMAQRKERYLTLEASEKEKMIEEILDKK